MPIPLVDLAADYRQAQSEIDEAIGRVLNGGWYILGKETAAFEEEFAAYCNVSHAVGVGNGTDAILLALRALDIGPGDEVITVAHTAVATVAAIELAGARPVLVDVDPHTYTINPAGIEAAITEHTRAIVPVHLYGNPADLMPILEIADHHSKIQNPKSTSSRIPPRPTALTIAAGPSAVGATLPPLAFIPPKTWGRLATVGPLSPTMPTQPAVSACCANMAGANGTLAM